MSYLTYTGPLEPDLGRMEYSLFYVIYINPLSVNPIKWSNTIAENSLSVFDHFVGLLLKWLRFHLFQPSVAFHIETIHLICSGNQISGFYMKCNTGLKWING